MLISFQESGLLRRLCRRADRGVLRRGALRTDTAREEHIGEDNPRHHPIKAPESHQSYRRPSWQLSGDECLGIIKRTKSFSNSSVKTAEAQQQSAAAHVMGCY